MGIFRDWPDRLRFRHSVLQPAHEQYRIVSTFWPIRGRDGIHIPAVNWEAHCITILLGQIFFPRRIVRVMYELFLKGRRILHRISGLGRKSDRPLELLEATDGSFRLSFFVSDSAALRDRALAIIRAIESSACRFCCRSPSQKRRAHPLVRLVAPNIFSFLV